MIKQTAKERKLASVIEQELADAEGMDGQSDWGDRDQALRLYFGQPPVDKNHKDTTFEVTSTDFADMVTAVVAQLTPLLSTDLIANFEARGKQDEAAATSESAAVNNIIIEKNAGFVEIQEALKDALMLRNGAVKIGYEDTETVRKIPTTINDEAMPPESIGILLEPKAPNEVRTLERNHVKIVTTERKFCFNAVPLENIRYEASKDTRDLQEHRFFAELVYLTRSDLVEMGVNKDTAYSLNHVTENTRLTSRLRDSSNNSSDSGKTKDQEVIECWECYQKIDLDNDGISERYRVLYADRTILVTCCRRTGPI